MTKFVDLTLVKSARPQLTDARIIGAVARKPAQTDHGA